MTTIPAWLMKGMLAGARPSSRTSCGAPKPQEYPHLTSWKGLEIDIAKKEGVSVKCIEFQEVVKECLL